MNNLNILYTRDKGLCINDTRFAIFPLLGLVGSALVVHLVIENTRLANGIGIFAVLLCIGYLVKINARILHERVMLKVVLVWLFVIVVNLFAREIVFNSEKISQSFPVWSTILVGIVICIFLGRDFLRSYNAVFKTASRIMWADIGMLNTFYIAWLWEIHGQYIQQIDGFTFFTMAVWILSSMIFMIYAPFNWMVERTNGTFIVAIGGELIKIAAFLSVFSDLHLHHEITFPLLAVIGAWCCVIGIQVVNDSPKVQITFGPQPDTIAVVLIVSVAWGFLLPSIPEDLSTYSFRTALHVDVVNWVFMLLTFVFVTIRVMSMRINTKNYVSELMKLALTDAVTKTENRYALSLFVVQQPSWLLITDIDGFKAVNELRGSAAGDALLQRFCARLKAELTATSSVFRLSNDEFAILVPKAAYSLKAIGKLVMDAGEDPIIDEVGVSIGVTSISPGQSMNEALAEAAAALTHAKSGGRRRWVYLQEHLVAKRQREIDLQRSIVGWRGHLYLKYWPVLASPTPGAEVVMLEAVPVWDDPEVGKVDLMEMWMESERVGQASEVAKVIVTQWLRSARHWADCGTPRPISVYLPLAVMRDDIFMEDLYSRLSDAGDLAQWLVINVSEDVFGALDDQVVGWLTTLRETGVRIGVNDFGIGPAMVGEIASTPIDLVRVAPELLYNLNETTSLAVVRVLINLARELGMTIILSGVSTHHLHYLKDLGQTLATGPIAGKALMDAELIAIHQPPLPARAFEAVARHP